MRCAEWAAVGQRAAFDLARRGHHGDFEKFGGRQRGGRIEGSRAASMDLPEPGGPTMSRLCPPAAATSSARLALSWPLMSARSSSASRFANLGCGRDSSTCVPLKWLASWMSEDGDDLHVGARPGGFRSAFGRHIRPSPRVLAPMAAGSTPLPRRSIRRDRVRPAPCKPARASCGMALIPAISPSADRVSHNGFPFLGQVGGREVDGDAAGRQRQAREAIKAERTRSRASRSPCRQADDIEGRQSRRDLHLDIDRPHLDASNATVDTRWTTVTLPPGCSPV